MTDTSVGEKTVFFSDLPAGRSAYRVAAGFVAASTVIFLVLVPFAKVSLAPWPAFIAIYQSALPINDLITAVFLLCQSQFSQSKALSWLAGGYLFTALMSTAHALTFPGLFSPTGLLGAGPQTTTWLYLFWHSGFPLFVIGYARYAAKQQPSPQGVLSVLRKAGAVVAAVCGLTLFATLGQGFLPTVIEHGRYVPFTIVVVAGVWILNLSALLVMLRHRPYSILELWLIVTMCAWLFDIALMRMLFNAGHATISVFMPAGFTVSSRPASVLVVLLDREQQALPSPGQIA